MTHFFSPQLLTAPRPAGRARWAVLLLLLLAAPLLGRAGTPVLTFQGTVPFSGTGNTTDVMAFVDQVEIINASTGAVVAGAVPNASFETFASLTYGNYGYNPAGAGWTFSARSGIASHGSYYNTPPPPNGSYAAYVHTTGTTNISGANEFSQTLPALPAGMYQVRVKLAQRNFGQANQGVAILIDGREVGRSVPINDNAFHSFTSMPFLVNAVLRLEATGSATQPNADVTAFVDLVELVEAGTTPAVPGAPIANPSFEIFTPPLSNFNYGYRPAGATWTYLNNSGVASSVSPFGNPNPSPDGSYVAFLQSHLGTGSSFSQVLPGALSGTYQLRLRLAQRTTTAPANQGVRVYVDNKLLATFYPTSAAFQTFLTPGFSPAGQMPSVASLSPSSGAANTQVVMSGSNLSAVTSMLVNGVPATIAVSSPNALGFTVPPGCSGTQLITLNYPGGQVLYYDFRVELAQTSVPAPNAPAAPVANSAVTLAYSEPVTTTSPTGTARVFSAQVGGRKAGTTTVNGSMVSYRSTLPGTRANFMPGEVVSASFPAVQGSGGLTAPPHVLQFTAATSGSGTGNFSGYDLTVPDYPTRVALGDVDGDGDLDAVCPSIYGTVNVCLNDGTSALGSVYSNVATNGTSSSPALALGDVDGDGDLDLVAANYGVNTVSVRLNLGWGVFSGGSDVAVVGRPGDIALADVDGDGDLDLLVATNDTQSRVSIRLNTGTGTFAGGSDPPIGAYSDSFDGRKLAVGDLDGDGDLDLVATNFFGYAVDVALNDGNGGFVPAGNVPVGAVTQVANAGPTGPISVTLGDVDGDGDLDLVAGSVGSVGSAGSGGSSVSVRLNNGSASFTGGSDLLVNDYPTSVALGDADADGDLDLFAVSENNSVVNMRLNNGAGVFTAGSSNTYTSRQPKNIALGDMDGDGDLDFVTSCSSVGNVGNNKLSVRLNRAPPPAITSFSPSSGVAGTLVTVTGTNLLGASSMLVNNVTVIPGSATQTTLQFIVPAGANFIQSISVTTPNGTSLPSTAFTVLLRASSTTPAANAAAAPTASSAVNVTFTEPIAPYFPVNVAVFSAQVGGRKAGTVAVSGSRVSYASTLSGSRANFMPGELVGVSVLAAQSVGELRAPKQVFQFTAATSGTGRGYFNGGSDPAVGNDPNVVAVGDVDGDGDLDLLTTSNGTVSVRLNDGAGNYAGGSNPAVSGILNALALGDVDGDGDLDFVTTSGSTNTVSVRLNNGTGTFGGGSDQLVGTFPTSVALGDVDGDGDLDLLTANNGSATVSVLLNNGSGVFSGPASVSVGTAPVALALGDVDGDGDLDVLTANVSAGTVSVRLNDGAGNFAGGSDPAVSGGPICLAVGDVDGDGDLDLLTANNGSATVSVRLNNGAGSFGGGTNQVVGSNLIALVLGDVDADGDLDLLTTGGSNVGGKVYVRFNNGAGVFGPGTDPAVGNNPQGLAVGDVDGDGDLDLLTANATDNTVSVRLNQPPPIPTISSLSPTSGVAGTVVTLTGTNLTGAFAVTVNGVAVTPTNVSATGLTFVVPPGAGNAQSLTVTTPFSPSPPSTAFTVLLRVAASSPAANARTAPVASSAVGVTFSEPVTAASAASVGVFSAQVGGRKVGRVTVSGTRISYQSTLSSGRANFRAGELVSVSVPPTVLGAGGLALTPRVFQFTTAVKGTGIGNFLPPATRPDPTMGSNPQGVALGDVDGDGDLDLVTANLGSNTVSIRLGNGSGLFGGSITSVSVGSTPYGIVLADVDGDGNLDLLTANNGSNTVSIRLNKGTGTFGGGTNVAVGGSPQGLAVGDVDGDGDLDLLAANNGGNTVSVRLNDGTGTFAGSASVAVGTAPVGVVLGDVDNDGDLDLLTTNATSNTVSVRLNDGTGSFSGSTSVAVGNSPQGLALGDVDRDGDLDLLVANRTDNTVSIRLGNGLGGFAGGSDPAVGSSPQGVALGDVDGDGDLDLLAANNGGNTVSIRLNDGAGSFGPNPDAVAAGTPFALALGDVDNDGDLDLVIANSNIGSASVRLNQPPAPTISSFSPASGAAGTLVTLTGTYLTGATALTVNGVTVTPTPVSATSLRFTVPAGASSTQAISVTTPFGTSAVSAAFTVLLRVAGTTPVVNAKTASVVSSAVGVTFTEPVTTASAANLAVFSAQVGGRKAGTATVSGNGLSYQSTLPGGRANFRAGEVVSVSVPATVRSAGSLALTPRVLQFTTAVGGPGRGTFQAVAADPLLGTYPTSLAVGDVDGDGDLDVLTGNELTNDVSVRLNNGIGDYQGSTSLSLGTSPRGLALGDVDGDGDLDLVTANLNTTNAVSVFLNDGTGTFVARPNLPTSSEALGVALADVDADGDLDLLVANNSSSAAVSIRLNDGTGTFAGGSDLAMSDSALGIAVGDVDGDLDLDLLTVNGDGLVNVVLNDGTGTFAGGSTVAVSGSPYRLVVGDVDGDGDLDVVTNNYLGNTVNVRLNNGSGTFSVGSDPVLGGNVQGVALGDVDADGDLDLVATTYTTATTKTVSVRLNNGQGVFAGGSGPAVSSLGVGIALADVDSDGDLDLLTANFGNNKLSVRLNQSALAPTLTAINPAAELPGQAVLLTGINFTTTSTVTFGGVGAGSVQYVSPTSLRAVVPAGAAPGTSSVAVTTDNGRSATSVAAFEVLQVYRGTAASGWSFTFDATVTGSGGPGSWVYLRAFNYAGGGVVAAIEDTRNLGTVRVDYAALGTATTAPVRRNQVHHYLDRNFYLTATNKTFPGQSVRVRFFGLTSELTRLTAADPTATAAGLKAWQYSGPNEDCNATSFANNAAPPTGEYRLLPAPATILPGADWFTSEVTVADHFSEFYLTGTSTPGPLPVELAEFTAQASGPAAVRLAWRTASEQNSARFEVERSQDGRSFGKIGEVAAAGSSITPRRYELRDEALPAGAATLYYRLKQVDADGTFSYSPVRTVARAGAAEGLSLFPNPAHGGAATLTGAQPGTLVTVVDALGRPVVSVIADAAGTAALALPAGLATGVYVVRAGAKALRLTVE